MIRGFRMLTMNDDHWGELKLMVVLPKDGDPWGVLAPIRDTVWSEQVQVVSGEVFSHALHGYWDPLMRAIGPEPRHRAKRIPLEQGQCALFEGCVGASPECCPGGKTPGCYEPPGIELDLAPLIAEVVFAWRDGRYVLVVEGESFNLA